MGWGVETLSVPSMTVREAEERSTALSLTDQAKVPPARVSTLAVTFSLSRLLNLPGTVVSISTTGLLSSTINTVTDAVADLP